MAKLQQLTDITLDELIDSRGEIWVQSRTKMDIIMSVTEKNTTLYIPKTLPVCLTKQTTKKTLALCGDLYRLIGNSTLILIDPTSIETRFKDASAKRIAELSGNTVELMDKDKVLNMESSDQEVKIPDEMKTTIGFINAIFDRNIPEDQKSMDQDQAVTKLIEYDLECTDGQKTYIKENLSPDAFLLLKDAWNV